MFREIASLNPTIQDLIQFSLTGFSLTGLQTDLFFNFHLLSLYKKQGGKISYDIQDMRNSAWNINSQQIFH